MVRLTDRPDMTIVVNSGCKTHNRAGRQCPKRALYAMQ